MERAKIEISKPRRFGLAGVLANYAIGILIGIIVIAGLVLVSSTHLGIFNLLIPLLTLGCVIYVLPFFGNAYISRVVAPLRPPDVPADKVSVVQITLCPRIRNGLRALIEDADDVGCLTVGESALTFSGDSVQMTIPLERISAVHGENVGLRGAYVTAGRITLEIAGLDGFEGVEIAERSSRVIFTSRRITRELFARIKARVQA